jgi:hypothetical protein
MVPEENKTEETNKFTLLVFLISNFIGLQNNHHPSQHTVGNVQKLPETVSKGLFRNRSQNRCSTFLDCYRVCKTCAIHDALQAGKQKEASRSGVQRLRTGMLR